MLVILFSSVSVPLLFVFFLLLANPAASLQTSRMILSSHDDQTPIVTLPLIPHFVQQERRRRNRQRILRRLRQLSLFDSSPSLSDWNNSTNSTESAAQQQRQQRRRRQLVAEEQFYENHNHHPVASLFQGYGTHYVDLWCGTPPQRQTVIVDTGSDVTGFPCTGCHKCGDIYEDRAYHTDALFAPHKSSTFETIQKCNQCLRGKCNTLTQKKYLRHENKPNVGVCELKASYREGSGWKAHEVRDYCYLGGWHDQAADVPTTNSASSTSRNQNDEPTTNGMVDGLNPAFAASFRFSLQFACQTSVSGAFRTQLADGILGMQHSRASLWRQLYAQYQTKMKLRQQQQQQQENITTHSLEFISDPSFSLCFGEAAVADSISIEDEPQLLRKGARAGLLTLGGVDPRLHTTGRTTTTMVYSRFGNRNSYYFPVVVRNIYLQPGKSNNTTNNNSNNNFNKKRPIRLNISAADLNERDVTIDSGSTDTYFTSKMLEPFQSVWVQLVGSAFDKSKRLTITAEQLQELPTILIQLKGEYEANTAIQKQLQKEAALKNRNNETVNDDDDNSLLLLAGDVDPDHPYDVMLAITPEHYYEYSRSEKEYHARIHFDKGIDSALGASSMMGYNIFFDSARYRIGWAKSTCNYDSILEESNILQNKKNGEDKKDKISAFVDEKKENAASTGENKASVKVVALISDIGKYNVGQEAEKSPNKAEYNNDNQGESINDHKSKDEDAVVTLLSSANSSHLEVNTSHWIYCSSSEMCQPSPFLILLFVFVVLSLLYFFLGQRRRRKNRRDRPDTLCPRFSFLRVDSTTVKTALSDDINEKTSLDLFEGDDDGDDDSETEEIGSETEEGSDREREPLWMTRRSRSDIVRRSNHRS